MSYYNVSDEAIAAEKALRLEIINLQKDLLLGAKSLIGTFQDNQAGLGAHDQSILALLEDLADESADSSKIKILTKVLRISSDNRQLHKDRSGYGKSR